MFTMKSDYRARLNRVVDYIDAHIADTLNIETVAEVAAFSKYHFHRVFSAAVGEPLAAYIQRLRLEKAAAAVGEQVNRPITEIAYDLGFSSPAVFSRAFKEKFGMSPSTWRKGGWREHGKNCTLQSNRYKPIDMYRTATKIENGYGGHITRQWRLTMNTEEAHLNYTVQVKDFPEKAVAYVRHTGPYAGDEELFSRLFGTLMRWAGPRDLFVPEDTEMLTIYHDSPEITEEEKLRISVCMTVPEGTEVEGEIGYMKIPAGRYAVGTFHLDMEQIGDAWNSLFGGWLPESGYQCTEGPCYELYLNDPAEDPEGKHHFAIHVPVKPL
jgi:AraC family transcriptional regulator